jgi:hypothetical protein
MFWISLLLVRRGYMSGGYERVIRENLSKAFSRYEPSDLAGLMGGALEDGAIRLKAFGKTYELRRDGLFTEKGSSEGPEGVVVSLYAVGAGPEPLILEPFKAFKDLPGSMPYHGAFAANSERILVPFVETLRERISHIAELFSGRSTERGDAGDFSAMLLPLPKICLKYVFYMPDEDFPASVTCLFSSNAQSFLPLDGLADLAEYTSKAIRDMAKGA